MTRTSTTSVRRRRFAALMLVLATVPALVFVIVRTYSDGPTDEAVRISAGSVSAEGGGDEDAVLPDDLTDRLLALDAEAYEGNPYVTFSALPRPVVREPEGMRWPVSSRYRITSAFGPRGAGFHHGIDIGCPLGAPALAAAAGRVMWTGPAPVYGNLVVIHHGSGTVTLYAHLDRFAVGEEDTVTAGQILGTCGTTGRSTGPHLHFEVRQGGKAWDPLRFLPKG